MAFLDPPKVAEISKFLENENFIEAAETLISVGDRKHRAFQDLSMRITRELMEAARVSADAGELEAALTQAELAQQCCPLSGDDLAFLSKTKRTVKKHEALRDAAEERVRHAKVLVESGRFETAFENLDGESEVEEKLKKDICKRKKRLARYLEAIERALAEDDVQLAKESYEKAYALAKDDARVSQFQQKIFGENPDKAPQISLADHDVVLDFGDPKHNLLICFGDTTVIGAGHAGSPTTIPLSGTRTQHAIITAYYVRSTDGSKQRRYSLACHPCPNNSVTVTRRKVDNPLAETFTLKGNTGFLELVDGDIISLEPEQSMRHNSSATSKPCCRLQFRQPVFSGAVEPSSTAVLDVLAAGGEFGRRLSSYSCRAPLSISHIVLMGDVTKVGTDPGACHIVNEAFPIALLTVSRSPNGIGLVSDLAFFEIRSSSTRFQDGLAELTREGERIFIHSNDLFDASGEITKPQIGVTIHAR